MLLGFYWLAESGLFPFVLMDAYIKAYAYYASCMGTCGSYTFFHFSCLWHSNSYFYARLDKITQWKHALVITCVWKRMREGRRGRLLAAIRRWSPCWGGFARLIECRVWRLVAARTCPWSEGVSERRSGHHIFFIFLRESSYYIG